MGMKLDEVIPMDATITLGGKEYGMRKVNLQDEVWLTKSFGNNAEYVKMFSEGRFDQIAKLIFRLLKDKSDWIATEEEAFDDDGRSLGKKEITGPERILKSISGTTEATNVLRSVMMTIGISHQVFDETVDKEIKKKAMKAHKKLTGRKSST